MIPIGTLCYVVSANRRMRHTIGHVVEVISPPIPRPQCGGTVLHEIDSPWLRAQYTRAYFFAEPHQLRPIVRPAPAALERTREPVEA